LAGSADFLVTEDKHFGVLAQTNFPAINVVKITEFLDLLKR
jgi:predicted nucleic acid-binding protein